jgi:hypothetical protein
MRLPGGIRVRLAVGLLVVVGGALLVAYLIVAPSLEKRLVDAKLSGLEKSAVPLAQVRGFGTGNPLDWQNTAEIVAVATNARTVVLSVLAEHPLTLTVGADSSGVSAGGIASDPVALRAAAKGVASGGLAVQRGRLTRGRGDYAEVAVARSDGVVVLFS